VEALQRYWRWGVFAADAAAYSPQMLKLFGADAAAYLALGRIRRRRCSPLFNRMSRDPKIMS
jgi:hypothetical protein